MTLTLPSRSFSRVDYYRRVMSNYVVRKHSHLNFWHETPEVNADAPTDRVGQFYMTFRDKADYPGPFDERGVPQLAYGGRVGLQYNPIATAQYGLALFNRYAQTGDVTHRAAFLRQADWLVENLQPNAQGVKVWTHHFDWEYRNGIKAPWDSGLSQGNALSCLARAWEDTGDTRYATALHEGFAAFRTDMKDGGVSLFQPNGDVWIEEVIVDPPSHILNGFLWAWWGVRDYFIVTGDSDAEALLERTLATIRHHLHDFDTGRWSLYELSPYRLKMIASPFYHQLHIVQLRVMHKLTGDPMFTSFADRWEEYQEVPANRRRSLFDKALFKVFHY